MGSVELNRLLGSDGVAAASERALRLLTQSASRSSGNPCRRGPPPTWETPFRLHLEITDKLLDELFDFTVILTEGGNDTVPVVLEYVSNTGRVLYV